MIRLATTADAAVIATIYNHYVSSSTITFEEHVVGIDEMAQRIWRDSRLCLRNALACPQRLSFLGRIDGVRGA